MLVELNNVGEQGYARGALVRLRNGGPKMEVEKIREDGYLECAWMDKHHELQRDAFHPTMLKSAAGIWG
jgi:uncharacterized protein YodC (DUF2158 family)